MISTADGSRRASGTAVRRELAEQLYSTVVPNAVMTSSFAVVGLSALGHSHDSVGLAALSVGTGAGIAKLCLLAVVRWSPRRPAPGGVALFASLSVSFAAALGAFCARMFMVGAGTDEMLATGLLFGYCAGIVTRASVLPLVAGTCVTVAATPVILGAGRHGDGPHLLLSALFLVFMLGSYETIRSTYRAAALQISTKHAMADLADTDALTGLLNRRGLRRAYERMSRPALSASFAHVVDLDGFKAINDLHGHAVGDDLLRMVSQRLRQRCRPQDAVARVGGDEFVVLQISPLPADHAERFAQRIRSAIGEPFVLDHREVRVGASVGTAATNGASGLDAVLEEADRNLYVAKRRGNQDEAR